MGNGDRKSRKGKIRLGSFGVRRLRKKHKSPGLKASGKIAEVKTHIKPEVVVKAKTHSKEENPVVVAAVEHEVAIEKKEKAEITAETKTKTEAKPKEKAAPKAKEKKEVKAAPKAKKTKKEE